MHNHPCRATWGP
ncbi:hypothetical protein LINPERPRIM_LOCUS10102 [Linum perenne]